MSGAPLWAVILAGGRGTRFWPLSRRALPKQCLSLDGRRTLLQQTLDRLSPLVPPERVLVVTGPDMGDAVLAQLPELPDGPVLIEPRGRNTAPCIGWATVEVARRAGPAAVLAVLPADHRVGDPAGLRAALAAGADAAGETRGIVTLGITPTRPDAGYGYLEVGEGAGRFLGHDLVHVGRFTEKPPEAQAARWVAAGTHLWNAGMFVFRADVLRAAFARHLPSSAAALDAIAADPAALPRVWDTLDATSIDFGVMERADTVLAVPCDIGWSDVGTWESAGAWMPEAAGGRAVARAVVAVDAADNVVHAGGKVVALLGVDDLVVVDTPDALLVMRRGRGQDVRRILDALDDADDVT